MKIKNILDDKWYYIDSSVSQKHWSLEMIRKLMPPGTKTAQCGLSRRREGKRNDAGGGGRGKC